jgi:lipid II:glycine glycyltransferase (peptidoglycan interpeptide bridge formation enzyme)
LNIADAMLTHYNKLIEKKVIYSQFRNMTDMSLYSDVFQKNGYELIPHLDILLDLTQSEAQLFENLHKERKRNISQAIKAGLEFRLLTNDEEVLLAIELLRKTYDRVKVPISRDKLFVNAKELLDDKVRFFGAFYEGKMIAAQIRLCYKELIYAWYAGSDSEYFRKRPNDFLTWNVLLWSKANNFKVFDFGGAGNPEVDYSVRDYKIKYGGELVSYGRFEKTHKALLMKIGKKGYRLYKRRKR